MTFAKSVLKNTAAMVINKISMPLFIFILLIYIAKTKSAELLGQYSVVTTFFIILQILPSLGLGPLVIREIARRPALRDSYITALGIIMLASSFLFSLAFKSSVYFLHYPAVINRALFFVILSIFPGSLAFIAELTFVAFEKMEYTAGIIFTESCLRVLSSIVLLKLGFGLAELFLVVLVLKIAACLVYFYLLNRILGKFRVAFDMNLARGLLRHAKIFFPGIVLFLVFSRADHIFLSKLSTFENLGLYSAAYRVIEAISLILSSFLIAIFPLLSRYFKESPSSFGKICQVSLKYIILFMAPLVIYLYFLSGWLISLLYNPTYLYSVAVLKILSFYLVFLLFDQFFSTVLICADRQKDDLKALAIGSLIYLIFLYIFIKKWSIFGAALATLAVVITQSVLRYSFIITRIGRLRFFQVGFRLLGAVFLLAFTFIFLKKYNLIYAVIISGTLYLALLFFWNIISLKELTLVYSKK